MTDLPPRDLCFPQGSLVRLVALRRLLDASTGADGDHLGFVSREDALRVWTPAVDEFLPRRVFSFGSVFDAATGELVAPIWGERGLRQGVSKFRFENPGLDVVVTEDVRLHGAFVLDELRRRCPAPGDRFADWSSWLDEPTRPRVVTLTRYRATGPAPLDPEDREGEHRAWQARARGWQEANVAGRDRWHAQVKAGTRGRAVIGREAAVVKRRMAGVFSSGDALRVLAGEDLLSGGKRVSDQEIANIRELFIHRDGVFPARQRRPHPRTRAWRSAYYRAFLEGGEIMRALVPSPGFAEVLRDCYPDLYVLLRHTRQDLYSNQGSPASWA